MNQKTEYKIADSVLKAVSPEARNALEDFAKSIVLAEGLLKKYHDAVPSEFNAPPKLHIALRQNARLIHTMTWTKAILYSRAVVDSINAGNLLVAFQSMRAYIELVAAVRYTMKRMTPIVHTTVDCGVLSREAATSLNAHMHLLLHGGRFNWEAYFKEGMNGVLDRKRLKREKQQKASFENNSLRIGPCVKDWGEEVPEAEFTYDFLCDLVHPNKGSNLVLLVERDGGPIFDVNGTSQLGIVILGRIFPYVASLCIREMTAISTFFTMLGADE